MSTEQLDLNECFQGHPSFYFLKSDIFFNSALHLESIANQAGDIWTEEVKKHNVPIGSFKVVKTTPEQALASMDMSCLSVSKYLYSHSMELLVKALVFYKMGSLEETHDFCRLIDYILPLFDKEASSLNQNDIKKMSAVINEILIWSGRYPAPKKNLKPHVAEKIRQTIKFVHGYSNPLNLLDISFLKKFRFDLLHLEFTQSVLPKPVKLDLTK